MSYSTDYAPARPFWASLLRGWKMQCPQCGKGKMYFKFLKVEPVCQHCGLELHHQRADDAPPYFTIFIVGHILVPPILWLERTYSPSPWLQLAIFLPLILLLSAYFLPRVKGALIAFQWSRRMHGFEN